MRRALRQQRFDEWPEVVGQERLGHGRFLQSDAPEVLSRDSHAKPLVVAGFC
jgi:hypothetical protein